MHPEEAEDKKTIRHWLRECAAFSRLDSVTL
jgi:hypothetical protein